MVFIILGEWKKQQNSSFNRHFNKVFEFSVGLHKHQVELPEKPKDSSEIGKLSKTLSKEIELEMLNELCTSDVICCTLFKKYDILFA